MVYRGHLTGWEGRTTPELVAVKTLKCEQYILSCMQCTTKKLSNTIIVSQLCSP